MSQEQECHEAIGAGLSPGWTAEKSFEQVLPSKEEGTIIPVAAPKVEAGRRLMEKVPLLLPPSLLL